MEEYVERKPRVEEEGEGEARWEEQVERRVRREGRMCKRDPP
jgi:hypothetical protein